MIDEDVAQLGAFVIQPNDTIGVLIPESWTAQHMADLARHMETLHPQTRFIFLPAGARLITREVARELMAQLAPLAEASALELGAAVRKAGLAGT